MTRSPASSWRRRYSDQPPVTNVFARYSSAGALLSPREGPVWPSLGRLQRVDLAMTETGSGMRFAWVEAKMRMATDALDSPQYFVDGPNSIEKDAAKLRARAPTDTPAFLLTWVVHLAHSAFSVRYGAGHVVGADGWRTRLGVEECRQAAGQLLSQFCPSKRIEVKSGTGEYGTITLDAWLTALLPAAGIDPDRGPPSQASS